MFCVETVSMSAGPDWSNRQMTFLANDSSCFCRICQCGGQAASSAINQIWIWMIFKNFIITHTLTGHVSEHGKGGMDITDDWLDRPGRRRLQRCISAGGAAAERPRDARCLFLYLT